MIQVDHDDDPEERVKGSLLNVIVGAADAPGEPSQTAVTHRHVSCRGLYPPPTPHVFTFQCTVSQVFLGDGYNNR